MGHPLDTDMEAYPHFPTLFAALSKCAATTKITQLGDGRISIDSGPFRARVNCMDGALQIHDIQPDKPIASINRDVIDAMDIAGLVAKENAPRVLLASILLQRYSAIATDGALLIEKWHGIDLPSLTIPKATVAVLAPIKKIPVGFGFSPTTATFWFEDRSWVRTQLYTDKYPEVAHITNINTQQWQLPAGLWEGLDKVADFCENHLVRFGQQRLYTHDGPTGAEYAIQGALPPDIAFNINYLRMLKPYVKTVDWLCDGGKAAVFYGDGFRAILMQMRIAERQPEQITEAIPLQQSSETYAPPSWNPPRNPHADDDIPF